MRYSRFELFVMVVGTAVVIGTIIASISGNNIVSDVIGQLLILVTLFGGLHYGRKGAVAGFLAAAAINAAVTFATMSQDTGVALQLFVYRTLVYAFVAFMAGELINVRLKYLFVKLEHRDYVDDITNLYNRRYLSMLIEKYMGESDRYGNGFSLARLTVKRDLITPLKERLAHKLIRDIGNSVIRGNIRGPDEAARVGDTGFAVLFPNTGYEGAAAATRRVKSKINSYLDRAGLAAEREDVVDTQIFEYPNDRELLRELVIEYSSSMSPAGPTRIVR